MIGYYSVRLVLLFFSLISCIWRYMLTTTAMTTKKLAVTTRNV